MNKPDDEKTPGTENDAPVRSDVEASQGGRQRYTVWVLVLSVLMAVLIGTALLSNTEDLDPEPAQGANAGDTVEESVGQN